MRKLFRAVLASAVIAAALTGCGGSKEGTPAGTEAKKEAAAASGDAAQIKVATVGNEKHQSTIAATYFKDKIEELSGGQVKVTIYPNASLGSEREAAEGVKLGTLEMTIVTTDGTLPSWVSDVQLLSIPYLFENKEEAYYILDEVLQPEFEKLFEAQGFKHLGFSELGFRHFTNNVREVVKASDMEGLSIRVQEATVWFSLMDCLKARGTALPFNELYTALQQGTVDGQENPIVSIASSGFDEVQKYMVLDGHTYGAESVIMNLGFYDKQTDEVKGWIDEAVKYAIDEQRTAVDSMEAEYMEQIKNSGVKVSEPDIESFKEATKDFYKRDEIKELVNPELVELVMQKLDEHKNSGK
ncbi:TRAP transporter substrate-binding protein DctP [Clostridium transplantifaecale]|uniref:TRAP transporter substrate-binding protein n=1 Tax=Clostridium transplantifaecale TaxID=2479838 RepID=UPI000F632F37|nr:TRAP transporter substrate-binding protein DctP [Clostridium transplantifaecale]